MGMGRPRHGHVGLHKTAGWQWGLSGHLAA